MDYLLGKTPKTPTAAKMDSMAAGLAAVIDYSGMLDRVGGDMGVGMNAAFSSFISLLIWNQLYVHKYKNTSKIYQPMMGGIYSGIMAVLLNKVLGNNIQNPRLLGAIGTFVGTYGAADKDDPT